MRASQNSEKKAGSRRPPALARWPLGRVAFGVALTAAVVAGAGIGALLGWLGLLHATRFKDASSTTLDVVKLVLAVIAGVGAVIGLVIAYRRQLLAEYADSRERERAFNERFSAAAEQLGSDRAGVRLAGVYSMERLADDWPEGRQKCVDVLCALARRGHADQPDAGAGLADLVAWQDDRQFRHAILRVIAEHLRPEAPVRWSGLDFDLTGTRVDGGDFERVVLDSGRLILAEAAFVSDQLTFIGARILGSPDGSAGGQLDIRRARFERGVLDLSKAEIGPGGIVDFSDSHFAGGLVDFGADTIDGTVYLCRAHLAGTEFTFSHATIHGLIDLRDVAMTGGTLRFEHVEAARDHLDLNGCAISGGRIAFTPDRRP